MRLISGLFGFGILIGFFVLAMLFGKLWYEYSLALPILLGAASSTLSGFLVVHSVRAEESTEG